MHPTFARLLRKREEAVAAQSWTMGLISVLIVILVGIALLTPIQDSIDNSSATGASAALLDLVPLLVVIAIVLAVVYWAIQKHKG